MAASLASFPARAPSATAARTLGASAPRAARLSARPISSARASLFLGNSKVLGARACGGAGVAVSGRRGGLVVHAKKQTFTSMDDMLENSDLPVLVDFYATWCGPCQMMAGILNSASPKLKDQVLVVKIDTDKYPDIATRFGVQGLPTLAIFRKGKMLDRVEGALMEPQLVQWVSQTVNKV